MRHVVTVGQPDPQQRAEDQGQGQRAGRHPEGDALAAPDEAQVHLVADHEHEQQHAEVRQRGQRGDQRGREQRLGEVAVEERGSERDPGEDLAEYRGLPEAPRGNAQQPGQDDDDGHIRQEQLDRAQAHGPPPTSSG